MNAPIGIFDSGIGGLTVAKALVERLPRESLYYVGDTAHMPYGDKSVDSLKEYAAGISQRFVDAGCKAVVVACNSASSNALDTVKAAMGSHVPVVDVVQPVVNWVAQAPPWKRSGTCRDPRDGRQRRVPNEAGRGQRGDEGAGHPLAGQRH